MALSSTHVCCCYRDWMCFRIQKGRSRDGNDLEDMRFVVETWNILAVASTIRAQQGKHEKLPEVTCVWPVTAFIEVGLGMKL